MQARRSITLREWAPARLELSPAELVDLQHPDARIDITPLGGVQYIVRPTSVIGTLRTERIELVIRPKLAVDRIFYLLAKAERIDFLGRHVALDSAAHLDEGFARLFLALIQARLRRGLPKGYVAIDESMHGLRGRMRAADQLRRRPGLPLPVEVTYDDFTEDIPENRIIKAALRRLSVTVARSPRLRRRLAEAIGAFGNVSDIRQHPKRASPVTYTRLNEPLRPLVELALLILRRSSIDLAAGGHGAGSFLIDMNRVFEDFIFESLRERLVPHLRPRERWRRAAVLPLDRRGRLLMEPDLALWNGRMCTFVGDAKYKSTKAGELSDLYQLLAYCSAAEVDEGLLIYAEQEEPHTHAVRHGGPNLHVASLNLAAPVTALEREIDALAHTILTSARRSHETAA